MKSYNTYYQLFSRFSELPKYLKISLCIGAVIGLTILVLYLLTLYRTLMAISEDNRRMQPGLVWLLAIPFFSMIWSFYVVIKISDSIKDEADRLNIQVDETRPTFGIGMAMAILAVLGNVPIIGGFASWGYVICWIVYWVKVSKYKKLIIANEGNVLLDAEKEIFNH